MHGDKTPGDGDEDRGPTVKKAKFGYLAVAGTLPLIPFPLQAEEVHEEGHEEGDEEEHHRDDPNTHPSVEIGADKDELIERLLALKD